MAQVKAHEVERYLKKLSPAHRVFLVYGPDAGLVSERAAQLAKASGAKVFNISGVSGASVKQLMSAAFQHVQAKRQADKQARAALVKAEARKQAGLEPETEKWRP